MGGNEEKKTPAIDQKAEKIRKSQQLQKGKHLSLKKMEPRKTRKPESEWKKAFLCEKTGR